MNLFHNMVPPQRLYPGQIAWRYLRDPWWMLSLGVVALLAFFSQSSIDFESTWQARPLGTFIGLYSRFDWVHWGFMQSEVGNRPLWSYFALWAYFLLSTFAADFAINRLSAMLGRLARRVPVLTAIGKNAQDRKFVLFTRLLARLFITLQGSAWLAVDRDIHEGLKIALKVAASLYSTWLVLRVSLEFVGQKQLAFKSSHGELSHHETDQIFYLVGLAVKFGVVTIMSLLLAQNLGINITALLAPLAVGSLAFSLGAQDTVANLFGALIIYLDKPFRVGERTRIDAVEGRVEMIGLRSMRICDNEGCLVTLPNKVVNSATITNLQKDTTKSSLNVYLSQKQTSEKIARGVQITHEAYASHPLTHDVWVSLKDMERGVAKISVLHWAKTTDGAMVYQMLDAIHSDLRKRLEKEHILWAEGQGP